MEEIFKILVALVSSLGTGILFSILKNLTQKKHSKITIKSKFGKKIEIDITNIKSSLNTISENLEPPQIFLSYSSNDKPFAKKLADDLKKNGVRTWYDEYELKVGDNLLERIKDGIDESAYYGVILSKAYLQSKWAQKELKVMLQKELKQNLNKILSILIDDIELPSFLQSRIYANFVDDYNSGLKVLLKKLKAQRITKGST